MPPAGRQTERSAPTGARALWGCGTNWHCATTRNVGGDPNGAAGGQAGRASPKPHDPGVPILGQFPGLGLTTARLRGFIGKSATTPFGAVSSSSTPRAPSRSKRMISGENPGAFRVLSAREGLAQTPKRGAPPRPAKKKQTKQKARVVAGVPPQPRKCAPLPMWPC